MSFQSDDQPLIESYLLGRLDERDRADRDQENDRSGQGQKPNRASGSPWAQAAVGDPTESLPEPDLFPQRRRRAQTALQAVTVGSLLIPDKETTTRQTVLLTSSVLRGRNDLVEITAPPGVTHLDLKLILADLDDYPRYQAALFSASGRHLRDEPDLEAVRLGEVSAVSFTVEVRDLVEDLYEIQLSGVAADSSKEVLGFYYFRPPLPRQ